MPVLNDEGGKAKCGDCFYWNEDANTLSRGVCFRFPPQLSGDGQGRPTTDKTDMCGEFKRKPEPTIENAVDQH